MENKLNLIFIFSKPSRVNTFFDDNLKVNRLSFFFYLTFNQKRLGRSNYVNFFSVNSRTFGNNTTYCVHDDIMSVFVLVQ